MAYTINRTITAAGFDEVDQRTRAALCNVILRQVEDGGEVSAIDPVASMQAIDNDALKRVAGEVRDLLAEAIAAI